MSREIKGKIKTVLTGIVIASFFLSLASDLALAGPCESGFIQCLSDYGNVPMAPAYCLIGYAFCKKYVR